MISSTATSVPRIYSSAAYEYGVLGRAATRHVTVRRAMIRARAITRKGNRNRCIIRAVCTRHIQQYGSANKKYVIKKFRLVFLLRLIVMRIRFRASDFGLVANTNLVGAKSKQASCAEVVLGSFVFLLV